MAKPLKIRNRYYSNLDMPCDGVRCPTTDATGPHIHRKRIFLSRYAEEAQRMIDDMAMLKRSQKHGFTPRDVSWRFFKTRYLEYCYANKKKNTIYRDELAFRMMEETIPLSKLTQVSPEFLELLKARWKKAGKSLSTVTRAIKSIKTAMHKAEEWKYIGVQNWRSVRVVEPPSRLIYWTIEQCESLLRICNSHWRTAVMLGVRAGLRSGEIHMLERSDIDFERHHIWIHPKDGWEPKGAKQRYVEMKPGSDLESYLKSLPTQGRWILGAKRPTLGSLQGYLKRLIKKANLPGSPHTMRHTFASHLISNGSTIAAVGELLGHTNPKTTKIYTHLEPYAKRNAINNQPDLCTTFVQPSRQDRSRLISNGKGHPRRKTVVLGVH